jgi:DNA-binding transcriptional regulator YdaS (Cro superfamily)
MQAMELVGVAAGAGAVLGVVLEKVNDWVNIVVDDPAGLEVE